MIIPHVYSSNLNNEFYVYQLNKQTLNQHFTIQKPQDSIFDIEMFFCTMVGILLWGYIGSASHGYVVMCQDPGQREHSSPDIADFGPTAHTISSEFALQMKFYSFPFSKFL